MKDREGYPEAYGNLMHKTPFIKNAKCQVKGIWRGGVGRAFNLLPDANRLRQRTHAVIQLFWCHVCI